MSSDHQMPSAPEEMKSITVRIPSSDYRLMRIDSAEQMLSLSGLLRFLISDHLSRRAASGSEPGVPL